MILTSLSFAGHSQVPMNAADRHYDRNPIEKEHFC